MQLNAGAGRETSAGKQCEAQANSMILQASLVGVEGLASV